VGHPDPPCALCFAESQGGRPEQRDSHDDAKLGLVLVPPDARTAAVFVDSDLPEGRLVASGELGGADKKIGKKGRHLRRPFDSTAAVVIVEPKADHSPIANMAVKLKWLEIQLCE